MKLENFCCIGANFQNRQNDGKKQPQLFLYRSLDTNETIENMLSDGFFNTISDRVKENDLILLFHPEQENPREIVYCKVTRSDGNIVTIKKVSNVALDILVDPADSVLLPESIDAENLRDYLIALETHLNSNVVHNWEGADESVDGEKTWNEDAHFEKNISATGNLTVGGTTDITGATTIGDELTTAGNIILENEKDTRRINFKKSNDGITRGQIENRYVPNNLTTLNLYTHYNAERNALLSMSAGENLKSSVFVMAEENDEATNDTSINRRTIATQGWVNNPEKSLNIVHKTGIETIDDTKTFTADIRRKSSIPYGTPPSNIVWDSLVFYGADNKIGGRIVRETKVDGTAGMAFYVNNPIAFGDNLNWKVLGIFVDSTGYSAATTMTPRSSSNNREIATTEWVLSKGVMRPGMIIPYGGTSAPAGYLVCNGGSYNTSDYPELYNAIGYTWGSDGSKFRVPNLTGGNVPIGAWDSFGRYHEGSAPKITGTFNTGPSGDGTTGAFYTSSTGASYWGTNYSSSADQTKGFDAIRSSNVYNRTDGRIVPSGYQTLYIIKT